MDYVVYYRNTRRTPESFLMAEAGVVKTFLDHLKCQQMEVSTVFVLSTHQF